MIVQTKLGKIKGFKEDGVIKFFGLPYAEAPVGEHRFQKPVTKKAWNGCIEATAFSPKCPQLAIPVLPDNGLPHNEDCLYMNIWTSDSETSNKPVFVWIYGGNLSAGEGSTDTYEGSEFAKNGDAIVITFNYRVGIFGGFFNMHTYPETGEKYVPNVGLYDVLEALRWVKENIESFGGDNNNVTICGESAGASIIALLLGWKESWGLYTRAALESTFNYPALPSSDHTVSDRILACANLTAENASKIFALSTEEILGAVSKSCNGNVLACGAGLQENDFFKGDIKSHLGESCANVPVLIGFNHDEGILFTNPQAENFPEQVKQATRFLFESVIESLLKNEKKSEPTYVYRFDFVPEPMKNNGGGATHSAEMPYVFHNTQCAMAGAMQGDLTRADSVSLAMHNCWIKFFKTGNPGWSPCTNVQPAYMLFDIDTREVSGSWQI